ncbi:MAG: hypothetical protein LUC37_01890 [Prevotella sp.]|nr:hypothetical protein [Prevotella sp.]
MAKKKITVYWLERANNKATRDNICKHFGVESKISINGETIFEIEENDNQQIADLLRMQEEKFLQIRFK